jgi:hypothetical protein
MAMPGSIGRKVFLALFVITLLSACATDHLAYEGNDRPDEEVAVVMGGHLVIPVIFAVIEYWVVITDVDGNGNVDSKRVTEVELLPGWHCLAVAWYDLSGGIGGSSGAGMQGPFGAESLEWGFRPVGLEEDLEDGWMTGSVGRSKYVTDEICFQALAGHRYKIKHEKDQRGWGLRSYRTKHWFWIVDTLDDLVVAGTPPEGYERQET